jgi:hypothetical protein
MWPPFSCRTKLKSPPALTQIYQASRGIKTLEMQTFFIIHISRGIKTLEMKTFFRIHIF